MAVKRRKPARRAKVGALVLSCATTGGLTLWFAQMNSSAANADALAALSAPVSSTASAAGAPTIATTSPPVAASGAPTGTAATTAAPATAVPATAASTGAVQVFDGSTIDTRYGPIQVEVQITGGQITDIAVLRYPDNDGKSIRINAKALPTLKTETLSVQAATVDTVSGATYTSDGYNASLQSAIDQARSAGATTIA